MSYVVYGLFDPVTEQLRYVGKTVSAKNRQRHHVRDRGESRKAVWIQDLKSRGFEPNLVILQEFLSEEEALLDEDWYIQYYRSIGCNLLNDVAGGGGGKEKLREKKEKLIAVRFTKEEDEALLRKAASLRVSVSWVIRDCIYKGLARDKELERNDNGDVRKVRVQRT